MKRIPGTLAFAAAPPPGTSFIWITSEMKRAPAFRKMSQACREFIDYLEDQHMQKAGRRTVI